MGLSSQAAVDVLTRTDASSLVFADDEIRWEGLVFPEALLRRTRAGHLVGLGSCSFREPVAEMRSLLGASR